MPDLFRQSLRGRKEIVITVRGRRTGRKITLPVWFVLDDDTLWILSIEGPRTQWFRNVQADPAIVLASGARRRRVTGVPVTGRAAVRPVAERFREKYGRADVAQYYSRLDGAVRVTLKG